LFNANDSPWTVSAVREEVEAFSFTFDAAAAAAAAAAAKPRA
jgi:hypothetical protein